MYSVAEVERLAAEAGIEADEIDEEGTLVGGIDMELSVGGAADGRPAELVRAERGRDQHAQLVTLLQMGAYLRDFLSKPHHLVGRKGSTCPFMPAALRRNSAYMVILWVTEDDAVDDVKELVREYCRGFESLEPRTGPAALYRTLLICMPLIPLQLCERYIDEVQLELKGEVLRRGMMIGENHMWNNGKGLHNEWYPLRTPHPCLALRHMVPGDIVFIDNEKYPVEVRRDFIGSFVRTFETPEGRRRVSERQLQPAKDALAALCRR